MKQSSNDFSEYIDSPQLRVVLMKDDSTRTNKIGVKNAISTYQTNETSRIIESNYDILKEQKAFEK